MPSLIHVSGWLHFTGSHACHAQLTNRLYKCRHNGSAFLWCEPMIPEMWSSACRANLPTKTFSHASLISACLQMCTFSQSFSVVQISFYVAFSMERKQQWLSRLKREFGNSPLVSNVAFGFILMGLEKLVELEFECPCDPKWNGLFSSAFFVIPAVMAFMLMLIIQGCRYDRGCPITVSISSLVPPIMWLILLFLDGQYFACAMTDWIGRFVIVDKAAPQKWCEPILDDGTLPELMIHSQELFVESQVREKHRFVLFLVWGLMCDSSN